MSKGVLAGNSLVGNRIKLQELKAAQHLNGSYGTCISFDLEKGRYVICLDSVDGAEGKQLAVKSANLVAIIGQICRNCGKGASDAGAVKMKKCARCLLCVYCSAGGCFAALIFL